MLAPEVLRVPLPALDFQRPPGEALSLCWQAAANLRPVEAEPGEVGSREERMLSESWRGTEKGPLPRT